MADGLDIDFADLTRLAANLSDVGPKAGPLIRKAMQVTAQKVDESWTDSLKGSSSIPRGPSSISYDLKGFQGFGSTVLEAEIGPEVGRGGVGGLVGALEYGVGGRQAPTGFGARALQVNEEDFQKGLEIALEDAEKAAGL